MYFVYWLRHRRISVVLTRIHSTRVLEVGYGGGATDHRRGEELRRHVAAGLHVHKIKLHTDSGEKHHILQKIKKLNMHSNMEKFINISVRFFKNPNSPLPISALEYII
jgi:hypothetical protein